MTPLTHRPPPDPTRVLVADRSPELCLLVRAALAGVPGHPEIVRGSAADLGGYDVAVIGPSELPAGGLRRLARLHRSYPSTVILLALDGRPPGSLRDLVRIGADDLVTLPASREVLETTLRRAVGLAGTRCRPTPPAPAATGRVVTVVSPTGGAGKTFVATNTACWLARRPGRRVVLVDLDLQFGEVAAGLRLDPHATLAHAARLDAQGVPIEAYLDSLLVHHPLGFSVLAAPRQPGEADDIPPELVSRILATLRKHGDEVVVDTPSGLPEIVLAALDHTDHVYVLGTMDLPSIRNVKLFLGMLTRMAVPDEQVSIILNQAEPAGGLDDADVSRLFPERIRAVLPHARAVTRSVNLGVPLLAAEPDAPVARQLRAALADLSPDSQDAGDEARPGRFRLRRPRRSVPHADPAPAAVDAVPPPPPPAEREIHLTDLSPEPAPVPDPVPVPAAHAPADVTADATAASGPVRPRRVPRGPVHAGRCGHPRPVVYQVRGPPRTVAPARTTAAAPERVTNPPVAWVRGPFSGQTAGD